MTSPDGGKLPNPASKTIKPTKGYEASYTFNAITYNLNDVGKTYTYEVEESGSGDGVTNDTNTHKVRITITDPDKNGKLKVETIYDDGEHLTFKNTYKASGKATLYFQCHHLRSERCGQDLYIRGSRKRKRRWCYK